MQPPPLLPPGLGDPHRSRHVGLARKPCGRSADGCVAPGEAGAAGWGRAPICVSGATGRLLWAAARSAAGNCPEQSPGALWPTRGKGAQRSAGGMDARPRGLRRVRCLGGPSPSFHVCLVLLSHDLASVAPAPSHAPRLRPVRRTLGLHPTLPPGASARPRCSPARGAHRASSGLPSPRAQKGERLSGEQVAAVAVAARGWARAPPPGPRPLPGHCGLRPCVWPARWKAAGLAATTPTLRTAPAAGRQVKLRERVT